MSKKLRIAQISTPFVDVPPVNYGGTELVVYNLTEGLVRDGQDVTLYATGKSKTSAKLKYEFKSALGLGQMDKLLSPLAQKLSWAHALPSLYHAVMPFEEAKEFDIIHNHFHYYGLFFADLVKRPVVTTFHGDFISACESEIEKKILEKYKNLPWIAISNSQKNNCPINLNFVGVVHHGIPVDKFPFSEKNNDYIAWLGRITPRKGIIEAIEVAKATNNKLIIAGTVNQRDQDFFQKEIKPKIDGKIISYIGPVNHQQKVQFLKNAKLLLYPISWEEPFGLVMIETMACGTPVIAYGRGAVLEIVKDGQTGYIVKPKENIRGLVEYTKKLDNLSENEYLSMRKNCRKHIEKNFSVAKMVSDYEKIYYELLKK